jgi:rhamnosyltransferase
LSQSNHAVVIPLYGDLPLDLTSWVASLLAEGFLVVLVDNNLDLRADGHDPLVHLQYSEPLESGLHLVHNHNQGGVAGGFNRGIEKALVLGAQWVTLLDQDSRLEPPVLKRLLDPWQQGATRLLVGPMIWDGRRGQHHGKQLRVNAQHCWSTRLLISSGTTFSAADWPSLGQMFEWMTVDFVDHSWCFRAQARGFQLVQHPGVTLIQHFGKAHPNFFCRSLGMELYSPRRHFYQLRNLRWLLLQSFVPLDLRCKELFKMLVKPWLWLLCEPRKLQNLRAVLSALQAALPASTAWK